MSHERLRRSQFSFKCSPEPSFSRLPLWRLMLTEIRLGQPPPFFAHRLANGPNLAIGVAEI